MLCIPCEVNQILVSGDIFDHLEAIIESMFDCCFWENIMFSTTQAWPHMQKVLISFIEAKKMILKIALAKNSFKYGLQNVKILSE